ARGAARYHPDTDRARPRRRRRRARPPRGRPAAGCGARAARPAGAGRRLGTALVDETAQQAPELLPLAGIEPSEEPLGGLLPGRPGPHLHLASRLGGDNEDGPPVVRVGPALDEAAGLERVD